MEGLTTISVVAAGLAFSVSVSLLLEELLFGALFRLLFGRMHAKPARK